MSKEERAGLISTGDVERLMLSIRGKDVLLDRDVALLYGVETRIVNQAVRNNPKKFPKDYIIELDEEESSALRSKILTLEQKGGKGTLHAGHYPENSKSYRRDPRHHRNIRNDKATIPHHGGASDC